MYYQKITRSCDFTVSQIVGIDECLLVNASYALDDAHIVGITGVILSDQVKSLDWRARQADFITALPDDVIEDVLAKLRTLLG